MARARWAAVCVTVLLVGGAAVRLVRIGDPPLAYQATRQYHDALMARSYAVALGGDGAGVDPAVVRAAALPEIEPPVVSAVTAAVWRVAGAEPLWVPTILSIAVWLAGGVLLYLLLRRLASRLAGVVAVAVWSFLPFAVTVSRTFQPDPLMVAAIVAAVFALVVDDDEPSRTHLVVAAVTTSFAVFVKAPALFLVAPVFLTLTIRRSGLRGLWSGRAAAYAGIVALPAALWYAHGWWLGGFLRGQEGGRIRPELLVDDAFWRGWADLGLRSFGVVLPVAAVVGIALAAGRARAVGATLVAGYVAFGLVFTFHYMTHDYYHLPLVVVLALGVGLLADRLRVLVEDRRADVVSIAVVGVVAILLVVGARVSTEPIRFPVVPGAIPDATRVAEWDAPTRVGAVVDHSRRTVFLAPSFGTTLMYYGGIAGTPWPDATDGRDAESVLAAIRLEHGVDYFVVTDLAEWRRRPEIRALLRDAPRLASDRDFLVFDLRTT